MIDVDGPKEIRIRVDIYEKLTDWNINASVRFFDAKFIRTLMVVCIGLAKIKTRDFHRNTIEFIRGR